MGVRDGELYDLQPDVNFLENLARNLVKVRKELRAHPQNIHRYLLCIQLELERAKTLLRRLEEDRKSGQEDKSLKKETEYLLEKMDALIYVVPVLREFAFGKQP